MASCIFIGPPGAGKGTQRDRFVSRYGFSTIVPGDLMREEIKKRTDIGLLLEQTVNKGLLAPHELAMKVVERKLIEYRDGAIKDILFDGFPREIEQAVAIDESLRRLCGNMYDIRCVILFEVDDNIVVERIHKRSLISGRQDDIDDNVIKKRIEVYHGKISYVVDKYKKEGILHNVDGNGDEESVFKQADSIINKFFQSK